MNKTLFSTFLSLLLATAAFASPGGDISGTVKSDDGSPFRAAFVRAQNVKTKMVMMVLTNNQGQFRTDPLPLEPMKSGLLPPDTEAILRAAPTSPYRKANRLPPASR